MLVLILQNSLSLVGRFSPAVSVWVLSSCSPTPGPLGSGLPADGSCLQRSDGGGRCMAAAVVLMLDCHRVLLGEENR